jgi:hypothetical protein
MPTRRIPASAGGFDITVEIPGSQEWCEEVHAAFDAWTLRLAQSGPADTLEIMPAFEVVPVSETEAALFRLRWTRYPGQSAWAACKDAVDEVGGAAFPDLVGGASAVRVTVEVQRVVGRDVEVEE